MEKFTYETHLHTKEASAYADSAFRGVAFLYRLKESAIMQDNTKKRKL